MKTTLKFTVLITFFILISCKKKDTTEETPIQTEPKLIFKFKFDTSQARLNNTGGLSTIPSNHRAQSPVMNKMSAHYIELAKDDFTALGSGVVLFHAPETTQGGTTAIDFNQSVRVANGQEFFSIPLKNLSPGVYKWLRVSLAYQNYNIVFKNVNIPGTQFATGTLASFVGYNTYISNFTINTQSQVVNANKLQGFWGFETSVAGQTFLQTGQATTTTVVNPNSANSPIPAGSCVVTGQFVKPGGLPSQLIIVGNEKQDIVVTVSLSTNKSFEWLETNNDNYFEPSAGDQVVDMGIRGMIPYWE